MRTLLYCFCLVCSFTSQAQVIYEKGVVLDSLKVTGSTDETFALYLPSSFDSQKLSPIVFIFDPAARGAIGIQAFIPTSEKRGCILVCSNNAKNAPYAYNFDVANALFNHVFSIFSVKEDEMFISGFSGGARLATAIATLTEQFAGVVGCGAGFPDMPGYIPSTQKYAYVGLCGDRDMNFKEMKKNTEYLDLLEFNNTLITFEGEHRWPPSEQIERAFDWLYLQKLKNSLPTPQEEVLNQYHSDYATVRSLSKDTNKLFAAEQYQRMLIDYEGWLAMDSLKNDHQKLLRSPEYKNQKKALDEALKAEEKWVEKLAKQMQSDFERPKKFNRKWWVKEISKLDQLAAQGSEVDKKMVYRVKFDLFVRAYSRKNTSWNNAGQDEKRLIDRFSEMLYPKVE